MNGCLVEETIGDGVGEPATLGVNGLLTALRKLELRAGVIGFEVLGFDCLSAAGMVLGRGDRRERDTGRGWLRSRSRMAAMCAICVWSEDHCR